MSDMTYLITSVACMLQAVGAQAKAGSNGKTNTLHAAGNPGDIANGTQLSRSTAAVLPNNVTESTHCGVFQCQ